MSKPIPKVTRVVAVLFAVALVVLFFWGTRPSKSNGAVLKDTTGLAGEEPVAADDVIALLDGLKVGDALASSTVLAIDAPLDRIVVVDVGVGGKAFSVGLGLAGTSGDKPPPVTTGKYEIGYGHVRGTGELPPEAMGNAAEAIAVRVRRRENDVPVPAGM